MLKIQSIKKNWRLLIDQQNLQVERREMRVRFSILKKKELLIESGDDEDEDMIDEEAPDLLEEAMIDAGLGLDSEGDDHADA